MIIPASKITKTFSRSLRIIRYILLEHSVFSVSEEWAWELTVTAIFVHQKRRSSRNCEASSIIQARRDLSGFVVILRLLTQPSRPSRIYTRTSWRWIYGGLEAIYQVTYARTACEMLFIPRKSGYTWVFWRKKKKNTDISIFSKPRTFFLSATNWRNYSRRPKANLAAPL